LVTLPAKIGEKHPVGKWAEITTLEQALKIWGESKVGDYNFACLTGPSDVVVVDYDSEQNAAPEGTTFTIKTPRGWHRYYRVTDANVGNSVNAAKKVDIRGQAGIAILPPSWGPNGLLYLLLDDSPIADITYEDFLKIVPWYKEGKEFKNEPGWFAELYSKGIEEGERNNSLAKLSGYLITRGLTVTEVIAIMCSWSEDNCSPPLTYDRIEATVESIFRKHQREYGSKTNATEFNDQLKQASSDPENPFS